MLLTLSGILIYTEMVAFTFKVSVQPTKTKQNKINKKIIFFFGYLKFH